MTDLLLGLERGNDYKKQQGLNTRSTFILFSVYMTLNDFEWKIPYTTLRDLVLVAANICMICQLLLSIKNGMTYQRYSGLLDTLKTIHKKALSRLVPKKTCTPVPVCAGRRLFSFFFFFPAGGASSFFFFYGDSQRSK
ncbi:hypothetical protein BJV82DRAFT_342842 [Fennellomyces sp. T-0311]|nr:hypothetical protein BJV82DRAFT_342842 [Fennellomyces sp. T-0311]